jgi:hypothetical protein
MRKKFMSIVFSRRRLIAASALIGVFTTGVARPEEAKKSYLKEETARNRIYSLTEDAYNQAKKYGINVGDANPKTVFESAWPDARSILERRFVIIN